MLRQAHRLNSLTELALTKLDVLDTFDTIRVCVAYESDGKRYEHVPYHQSVLHKVRPVYETLPGWGVEIETASRLDDLPTAARDYVQFIQDFTGVSAPYEEPLTPEVRIDTTGVSPSESAAFVLDRLEQLVGVRV